MRLPKNVLANNNSSLFFTPCKISASIFVPPNSSRSDVLRCWSLSFFSCVCRSVEMRQLSQAMAGRRCPVCLRKERFQEVLLGRILLQNRGKTC